MNEDTIDALRYHYGMRSMVKLVANGLWKSEQGLLVRLKGETLVAAACYGVFPVVAEIVTGSVPEEMALVLKPVMPRRNFWLQVYSPFDLEEGETWLVGYLAPDANYGIRDALMTKRAIEGLQYRV